MDKQKTSFDEAEIALLKEALKRTYKERFLFATSLYKASLTMKKAVVTHKFVDDPHVSEITGSEF